MTTLLRSYSTSHKANMIIKTKDGKEFASSMERCVGSVKKQRDRDVNKPAAIGQFPVFVEQYGNYRMFTYSSKITEISHEEG